ncbi:Afadin [Hirschfeldia incana]|nr:Afadin [Hirschfeldia incana]
MNIFRLSEPSSRDRLASKVPSSPQGKKQSQKLKSPRLSSSEFHSCHCEALSQNKLHQDSAHQLPMRSLLAQEMSKQKETKRRSPSIIARLMGLDVLPPQSSSHRQHNNSVESQQGRSGGGTSSYAGCESLRRSSKGEQKFKDVFEVLDAKKAESSRNLYHQGRVDAANLTQAEMGFISQKFMEAKRLSTDEKLRHSKEYNDALEALDSNKDLLLRFLQQPDSLFTKHMHDLQSTPHNPLYGQAPFLKCPSHSQKVDRDSLSKSHRSPHRHGGGDGCPSHSHTRHASYETLDLPNVEQGKRSELQPTKIVVLKPKLGGRAFASPSSSSDEFRADRRLLPCTSNHGRQKSNEDLRLSRQSSKDSGEFSKIMSRQRKASFETSGFRGYAGDESSSGSDSASESELVPVTSRTRTFYNRKNHHRSLPSKSTSSSSVSREAKRRLSERWKLTHKYEQEIEISRSGTLAEMLATSDREARPASFNELEGISKRVQRNAYLSELPETVGISSRDGWKGSRSRSYSKSKTIMNQESTVGYTIVLPKELITRDGLVMGSSSHYSFLSSKSSGHGIPQKEKLSPSKTGCSFSVDANSDSEDSSASDDIKTARSSEAPDLSTVTSLTDPDISRMPTETVDHSSVSEPKPFESSKEGDQPSPVSILEATFDDDGSSSSECFESVSADLIGLRMQLQLLKLESAAFNEASMLVSTDEDTDQESSTVTDEILTSQEVREQDWKSLYLVDLLANSKLSDSDHNTVMETPVDPSLFQDLEKKYSSLKNSTRLDRKFLFDQISGELIKILKQFSDPHPWIKPKRVCSKWDANKIQETLRDLVTRKEEKPSKDDVEDWLRLEDDIDIIGRDIEEMLTDELIAELVVEAIL